MSIAFFSIAFELELLFDQIYSQQKNNTTLTAFDLFNFVLLIVYLITYRFSWQTIKANRCLISISKHLYIYISRTYKTVFSYFYWHLMYLRIPLFESHFIDLHCSAVPKSYDILTRDLISSNHIIKFKYHHVWPRK